ncbi:hypothetical protein ACH4SP_21875 [Streptomyces sp. NPDC021093]|uniref:hypothetical protein n=1 Tax=Streptomyces sp. NPDC021093 TaxID=3365112 RepID=UPI0037BBD835
MLQGKPADSAAQNHNNIAPELPVVLPVPLLKGDRQHNEATDPPWPALQELTDRFATKRHEDAAGVLRHLGGQASAAETSLAIASCRRSGLHEAADAILHYASQRDVWAVMSLTKTLLNDQQQAAAGVLLDLALDS